MNTSAKHLRLWFDPRSKLLILLLCILSAMSAPSLMYELGLVGLIALFGFASGKGRAALYGLLFYGLMYLFTLWSLASMDGVWRTMFIAFLGLFHKVYPCGFLAGILVSTTKVSEFLSAMNRLHAPKKLIIPLAVMMRYLPTIREDWHYIKDAMKMREVAPSLKNLLTQPLTMLECLYVPLMMAASKAADELSIAAITRGIENPVSRTCLIQISLGPADAVAVLCFLSAFSIGQISRGWL